MALTEEEVAEVRKIAKEEINVRERAVKKFRSARKKAKQVEQTLQPFGGATK
jgi:hypothetical protein